MEWPRPNKGSALTLERKKNEGLYCHKEEADTWLTGTGVGVGRQQDESRDDQRGEERTGN